VFALEADGDGVQLLVVVQFETERGSCVLSRGRIVVFVSKVIAKPCA